jgi:hypothetical protein
MIRRPHNRRLCPHDNPEDCALTHFAALMPETPDFVVALHRINDVALECCGLAMAVESSHPEG